MTTKPNNTDTVIYHAPRKKYASTPKSSIVPIGIDTEADIDGRCFMICDSEGYVWTPDLFPYCLFDRAHRDCAYVCYNLKYDMGALLQLLPEASLDQLRRTGKTKHNDFRYRVITNKYLGISKGHHSVQIYDIMGFYGGSLDYNAKKYLQEEKLHENTKEFTTDYIKKNWQSISAYCIQDAKLTKRLAWRIISQFNSWGLHVRKLYSTAHVSYSWFAAKCGHPSVGYFWHYNRHVLDYAMASYNGGKFEVTKKGAGYLYEYDISSAYPHSIRNLIGLDNCRVVWSNRYRNNAIYAFIDATLNIPVELPSPVAVKRYNVNTYPYGTFRKVITKQEYDYLITKNTNIQIHNACWIHVDKKIYPYRKEIDRLYALKSSLKDSDDLLAYHTVKILMNSLYGKFVQLIDTPYGWRAGASWNPIYASVITAETRVRMSLLQLQYPSVWAVHTDSVISSQKLPFERDITLGNLSYETEGNGMVAGCGIYQIGNKTALRGVPSVYPLIELATNSGKELTMSRKAPRTWRQVLANSWPLDRINKFEDIVRNLRPDMDRKRLWVEDCQTWSDLVDDTYESEPLSYGPLFYPFVS